MVAHITLPPVSQHVNGVMNLTGNQQFCVWLGMCSFYDSTPGKNAFRCGTKWAYNDEVREGKQIQKEMEVNL
jgi:uncharacterized protein (DUF427 family)